MKSSQTSGLTDRQRQILDNTKLTIEEARNDRKGKSDDCPHLFWAYNGLDCSGVYAIPITHLERQLKELGYVKQAGGTIDSTE